MTIQRTTLTIILLTTVLIISLVGNGILFFWGRQQANRADRLEDQIESIQQDIEELQQELEVLQSEARIKTKMAQVGEQTEELRDLYPLTTVEQQLVSPDEMRAVLFEAIEAEYPLEDAERDEIILSTLGLIPDDLDIYETLTNLLGEQVAGLYIPESDILYVISYRGGFGALEKVTFSHEYVHALQDQHFDLEALGLGQRESGLNNDQLMARLALVEGDATLSMQQYMTTHFNTFDLLGFLGTALTIDQSALNEVPAYFRKSFMFPYQDGMGFANSLYRQGGWEAVNEAYANPPQSSEQILHPHRYPDDIPQQVELPSLENKLDGWQLVDDNVLGEFGLQLYLDTHLRQNQAAIAADGWGGDRYAIYQHSTTQETLLVLSIVWDTPADQTEFSEHYQIYAEQRLDNTEREATGLGLQQWWVGEDVILLATNSVDEGTAEQAHSLLILAPNKAIAQQILTNFPEFTEKL
ncbi:MAG: hypothetical protein AAF485_22110 [Chloroflexota bacterium]